MSALVAFLPIIDIGYLVSELTATCKFKVDVTKLKLNARLERLIDIQS